MSLYETVRPVLFRLPPETAHTLGKATLRGVQATSLTRRLARAAYQYRHPALEVEVFGTTFPSPVGVAAGFDKNGEVTHALADLGFGFVEVGTVTPRPQTGNPRPRLFRLPGDRGMINRLGFNGQGAARIRERFEEGATPAVPVGINVGKMNDSGASEAVEDYRQVFCELYGHADYFVVNVSCPNTPDRFDEQRPDHLRDVLETLAAENEKDKPILVKLGPDGSPEGVAAVVDVAHECGIDGFVATNTTTDRDGVDSPEADEHGGLSGAPLEEKATETVRTLYGLTDRPIVGVGGVDSAESAYRKITAGARLVQLYTGFVYGGPSTARSVNAGLVDLLAENGFSSIEEAVGAAVDEPDAVGRDPVPAGRPV